MKRILIFLFSILSLNALGQIKISQFPTYSGDASDAWVPGIIGTTNYKFAGKNFAWHKLDSITVSNDTVYQWKRGTRSFAFKLPAGGGGGAVSSVFGRTGAVVALEADYQAFYPRLSQTYANPTWISSLAWSKITGVPSYLLISDTATMLANYRHWLAGYLTQAAGDARYPQLSGSYANPSWISSLAWSKISGAPTVGADLTYSVNATTVTISSNTGTDVVLPAANNTVAGVMTAEMVRTIDTLVAGDSVKFSRSNDSVYMCVKPFGSSSYTCYFQYKDSVGPGGGVGATDISISRNATSVTVNSNTGADGTIPVVDASNAGVTPAADYVNDRQVFSRTNPTGTVTHTYGSHGAHEKWTFTGAATPTLAYSGMSGSAVVIYTVINNHSSPITVTLPANSRVNGATSATLTLPTGVSGFALKLVDGSNYYFIQDGTSTTDPAMGGDLTGTASNAQIAANSVGTPEISNNQVTLPKLEQIPDSRFLGNTAGAIGNVTAQTPGQVMTVLPVFTGDAGSGGVKGVVPGPATGDAAANKYLHADGTWKVVSGVGTYYQTMQEWGTPFTQQPASNYNYPFDLADGDGKTEVFLLQREYEESTSWAQLNRAPWYTSNSGTGSAVALFGTGDVPAGFNGGVKMSSGTTVGGFATMYVGSAVGTRIPIAIDSNVRLSMRFDFSVPTLSNGTDRYEFWFGAGEYSVGFGSNVDGFGIRYRDDDSSGQIIVYAESNNSKSERATGVTLTAGVIYSVEISAYKGQVECYIKPANGTRVKAPLVTSNVPQGNARNTNIVGVLYKIAGTTNVDLYLKSSAYGTQMY